MVLIMSVGAFSLLKLGTSEWPLIGSRTVTVEAQCPGVSARLMEAEVVRQLEDNLGGLEGLSEINSQSLTAKATIGLKFKSSHILNLSLPELQNQIQKSARKLPKECEPPTFKKRNSQESPILYISVVNKTLEQKAFMETIENVLKPELSLIDGVAEVPTSGWYERRLRIWLRIFNLEDRALTVGDVLDAIQNQHKESPQGRFTLKNTEQEMEFSGESREVQDFFHIPILTRGGALNYAETRLGDIAEVEDGFDDITSLSRFQGQPSVSLGIRIHTSANALDVVSSVKNKVLELKKRFKGQFEIQPTFDATPVIRKTLNELIFDFVLALVLTGAILFFFLGSTTDAINVFFTILISVSGSFFLMSLLEINLSVLTMLALILGIGLVVDDAIVVLDALAKAKESHGRLASLKEMPIDRILSAISSVAFPVVATSLVLICMVFPLSLVPGAMGDALAPFSWVFCTSLVLSVIDALVFAPVRALSFSVFEDLLPRRKPWAGFLIINKWYRATFFRILRGPKFVFRSCGVLLVLTAIAFFLIQTEFIPRQDVNLLSVEMRLKQGSPLTQTDEKMKLVEKILATYPEIESTYVSVGDEETGDVHIGFAYIHLKEPKERPRRRFFMRWSTADVANDLRVKLLAEIPDVVFFVQDQFSNGMEFGGRPIQFYVMGQDWTNVVTKAKEAVSLLAGEPSLFTDSDMQTNKNLQTVSIEPDREKAALHHVNIEEIGRTLSGLIVGLRNGRFSGGNNRYDIIVRAKPGDIKSLDQIRNLHVRNNEGGFTPLSSVTKVAVQEGSFFVSRYQKQKAILVSANLADGSSQSKAMAYVKNMDLGSDVSIAFTGDSRMYQEVWRYLLGAFAVGVFITYLLLAAQFNNLIYPIYVLFSLPISLCVTFVVTYVSGLSLNFFSLLGFILVSGISLKNSVMIVDFIRDEVREKSWSLKSLIRGTQNRLRPIFLTALCTIIAALPGVIGLHESSPFKKQVASPIVFGFGLTIVALIFSVPLSMWIFKPVKEPRHMVTARKRSFALITKYQHEDISL